MDRWMDGWMVISDSHVLSKEHLRSTVMSHSDMYTAGLWEQWKLG
jgi:hypothetical protein